MSLASAAERQMLELINQERADAGLNPLRLNTLLNEASEDHSAWMVDTDTFSHTGQGGSSATERMQAADYPFEGSWASGENIAWQSERGADGIADDVIDLHQGLMESPGHRANILNPDFTEIGIGIEQGDMDGFDGVVVTQNFARTDGDTSAFLETGSAPAPEPTPTPTPEPDRMPDPVPEPQPTPAPTPEPDIVGWSDHGADLFDFFRSPDVITDFAAYEDIVFLHPSLFQGDHSINDAPADQAGSEAGRTVADFGDGTALTWDYVPDQAEIDVFSYFC